jgi:hypothetical protein
LLTGFLTRRSRPPSSTTFSAAASTFSPSTRPARRPRLYGGRRRQRPPVRRAGHLPLPHHISWMSSNGAHVPGRTLMKLFDLNFVFVFTESVSGFRCFARSGFRCFARSGFSLLLNTIRIQSRSGSRPRFIMTKFVKSIVGKVLIKNLVYVLLNFYNGLSDSSNMKFLRKDFCHTGFNAVSTPGSGFGSSNSNMEEKPFGSNSIQINNPDDLIPKDGKIFADFSL